MAAHQFFGNAVRPSTQEVVNILLFSRPVRLPSARRKPSWSASPYLTNEMLRGIECLELLP
jgi:hypothetical protein